MKYSYRLLPVVILLGVLAAKGSDTSSHYLDQALETQKALAAAEPRNPEVLNDLGNLLALAGENEEAEAAYRRALELEPGNAKTRYNLALILQEEGLRKEAIAEFRQVIEIAPDDAWAHYQLGRCYEESRRRSLAIQEYARAFELDSSLASPRVNPHIVANRLATEALLVAYSDRSPAGQAPRMYEEPARIAEILTPPMPTPEEEPTAEEVQQVEVTPARRISVQPADEDDSGQASLSQEPGTPGSRRSVAPSAVGATPPPTTDADIAASRRALVQRQLAAQAAAQESAARASEPDPSPPSTITGGPDSSSAAGIGAADAATGMEEAQEVAPEEEEDFEPATPSTGRGGTRVYPAPYQPSAPSTGRLELRLIPSREDGLDAG